MAQCFVPRGENPPNTLPLRNFNTGASETKIYDDDDDDGFVCDLVTDLSAYMKHVVDLEYDERPNYQHCRGLFTKALKSVSAKPTDKLEFGPTPAANPAPKVILHFYRVAWNGDAV